MNKGCLRWFSVIVSSFVFPFHCLVVWVVFIPEVNNMITIQFVLRLVHWKRNCLIGIQLPPAIIHIFLCIEYQTSFTIWHFFLPHCASVAPKGNCIAICVDLFALFLKINCYSSMTVSFRIFPLVINRNDIRPSSSWSGKMLPGQYSRIWEASEDGWRGLVLPQTTRSAPHFPLLELLLNHNLDNNIKLQS